MINFAGLDLKLKSDKDESLLQRIQKESEEIIVYQSLGLFDFCIKLIANNKSIRFNISLSSDGNVFKIYYSDYSDHTNTQNLTYILEDLIVISNAELSRKVDIIRCTNEICPICQSKLERRYGNIYNLACHNGCYDIAMHSKIKLNFGVSFFHEKSYQLYGALRNIDNAIYSTDEKFETVYKIYDEINYWKENDRYLMKIIKGEA
ncbi:gp464 [Bacillus phage G]|uniref:Gp464 n=1 Tax=Bacillus phage G TaxID=2884420 RepID=G3MAK5_9CAUD|nr:gp464 [Bacillus phage G]AEO93722.1 gp464 [Bacillus phage G]